MASFLLKVARFWEEKDSQARSTDRTDGVHPGMWEDAAGLDLFWGGYFSLPLLWALGLNWHQQQMKNAWFKFLQNVSVHVF